MLSHAAATYTLEAEALGTRFTRRRSCLTCSSEMQIHITLRCDKIMHISCVACFVMLTSLTNLCLLSHDMTGGL